MSYPSDETLMAYADGELDAATRAEVERALAADPALAQRVQQHQALRRRLAAAFAPELAEPVPERLVQAVAQAPTEAAGRVVDPAAGRVVDLAAVRAGRGARREWSWAQWGGMAASVLVGVALGRGLWAERDPLPFALQGGQWVARGAVAQALTNQTSGPLDNSPVVVKLSFIDRGGRYCRAFTASDVAGLACRDGQAWAVQVLTPQATERGGGLRQAASGLPDEILQATDRRIAGDPLNGEAEHAALAKGWQR